MDVRSEFPMLEQDAVYFDNAATSLKPRCVIQSLQDYYTIYGASVHRGSYLLAQKATGTYESARETIAQFINAEPSEVIFTRGATEALNQICLMLSQDWIFPENEVLATKLDHHSALLPWMHLAVQNRCVLSFVPITEDFQIKPDELERKINDKTTVLTINYSSNVTGTTIKNIKELVQIAHKHGVVVIVDATQTIPHRKIDVKDLDCDFLVFSGHKMFGPTGIGVLYGKSDILAKLEPVYYGGEMAFNVDVGSNTIKTKDAPGKFEAGTPPIAGAIGLASAVDMINEIGYANIISMEADLIDYFGKWLVDFPEIIVYNSIGKFDFDLPVFSFNFDGLHAHDVATIYGEEGICLRAGNHCAQPLVESFGVPSTVRASLSFYNTKSEIDKFFDITQLIINNLIR